jgi:hypothetical protein
MMSSRPLTPTTPLRLLQVPADIRVIFTDLQMPDQGKLLYDVGDGQWDIPKLRVLLGKVLPEQGNMENYEVEHDFPTLGRRTMLLNGRKVFYEAGSNSTILLGTEDITDKRRLANENVTRLRERNASPRHKKPD